MEVALIAKSIYPGRPVNDKQCYQTGSLKRLGKSQEEMIREIFITGIILLITGNIIKF